MDFVRFTGYLRKLVIIASREKNREHHTLFFSVGSGFSCYLYTVQTFFHHICLDPSFWTKNRDQGILRELLRTFWQWKYLGTMSVDHNKSEDGKGNLSPLFTSQHNIPIVSAALKPWCWGKLMTFLWHVKWLFTVATRQGQTLLATYLAFCQLTVCQYGRLCFSSCICDSSLLSLLLAVRL